MAAGCLQVISLILLTFVSVTFTVDTDYWTRTPTGCQCYFDRSRQDCACCQNDGCQCTSRHPHQCVMCGVDSQCGTSMDLDVWTARRAGCPCYFDKSRSDCACCKNTGCQCPASSRHQCVPCGYGCLCGQAAIILDPEIFQIEATLSETRWSTAQTTAVKEEVITASLWDETIVPKVLELTPSSQESNNCESSTALVTVIILSILLGLAVCIIAALLMMKCSKTWPTISKSRTNSSNDGSFRNKNDDSRYFPHKPTCPPSESISHYETINAHIYKNERA